MTAWLVDTLVATSVLMVLVLLVREPVRRQFGPAVAYGLWLIPALRMVMPSLTWTVERTVPAAGSLPLSAPLPAQSSVMPAAETSLIGQLGGWETWAVSVWLAGAAVMLICGLLIYRRQRREVLRDSVQVARLGKVRIVRTTAVRGPMAFGVFDRVIALPIDFDERYEPHERRLAFLHELAHHRSGDLVVNHFAFVLLCLQWFNPLAWASHFAFRFDQEAACDARVLDKVSNRNRSAYAHAIAKAASGRALLFAGALDRPGTLQRRLRCMLTSPSTGRRVTGKALIALTAAAVLPLTASWATVYVDVPDAAPRAPASAAVPDTLVQENPDGTVTLPGGVKLDKGSTAFFANDDVLINGKVKRLEQLTSDERSQLRATIIRSQRELAQERADLPSELAELRREADRARSGELRREYMRDREALRRDLAEIDLEADQLRAEGEDPEKRKAEILEDLREAEAIDIDKEIREAIEAADPRKVEADLRTEEEQMARMLARLDQLDRQ
jgi:beta-lactamase regulating signal transducer with metallopeptidase domain